MSDFPNAAVGGGYRSVRCGLAGVLLALCGMLWVIAACRAPRGALG
jgi:hypothetical protein